MTPTSLSPKPGFQREPGFRLAPWLNELRATVTLGLPLILTNLSQMAMTVTDVIFIGRLGPSALAASALGANLYALVMLFSLGLVTATAPMMAHDLGINRHSVREVRRTVRQGFWTAFIICIPAGIILWNGEAILLAIGQPPELAAQAGHYLHAMQWALPPFLIYLVLRSFVSALERPQWAFIAGIGGILFNIVANWVLVFGHLGFPALGIFGSGLATAMATLFLCLMLVLAINLDRRFRRYKLFGNVWKPDWRRLKDLWKLGLPIAALSTFEVSIFNAAAFMMGWLGEAELAAHAVAIQIASLSFMVPLGLAQAITVRVGRASGSQDIDGIARAGWTGIGVGLIAMVMLALIMVVFPRTMIGAFVDLYNPANEPVIAFAVSFLLLAALFQLVDGAQVLTIGALRGLKDTRIPMLFAVIGYWGVGLPMSALLAFYTPLRGMGIWAGLAGGLTVVSILVMIRWMRREPAGLLPRSQQPQAALALKKAA